MDHGGLHKLRTLMRIWWFIRALLDIVNVFYNIAALERMCVVLHTSMVTLTDSVFVRGKVIQFKFTAYLIIIHNRLLVW